MTQATDMLGAAALRDGAQAAQGKLVSLLLALAAVDAPSGDAAGLRSLLTALL